MHQSSDTEACYPYSTALVSQSNNKCHIWLHQHDDTMESDPSEYEVVPCYILFAI